MGVRKTRIILLGRAFSPLLKPLKNVAESGFQADVKDVEMRNFFSMIASYCCNLFEAKDVFAARHSAGRRQTRVR